MNDDWRLTIDLKEGGIAHRMTEQMSAEHLEHDLEDSFGDRVIVSRDGAEIFAYTGTREQAEGVEMMLTKLAGENDWQIDSKLEHWHPEEEIWEDPDSVVPTTAEGREAEHEKLIEQERAEAQSGHPEWEVRIELPSHRETVRFADRLKSEGLESVHRWKYVLVGALDEDNANELAERLRAEVPEGSTVAVEGTWSAALAERPPNPYAVLGGLGR